MKKIIIILLSLLVAFSVFGDTRFFSRDVIPFPHKMEPFINDYLENYLSPQAVTGDYWFVDAAATGGVRTGTSWANAFLTITEGEAAMGDGDVLFIAEGDYEEDGVVNFNVSNVRVYGPGFDNQNVAMVYVADSSNHAFTINANNVEIAGLGFTVNKDTYSAIMCATTAAAYKIHIHDCRFDGYGKGEYGVNTGTTYDSPDIVVENCVFRSNQTAAIYANATRGIYRNNTIFIPAGSIGIELVPNAADRPHTLIDNNIMLGVNSTDTGIKITNTPTALYYMITRNLIAGCNTTITSKATNDAACILNYTGDANGGALIDPSP